MRLIRGVIDRLLRQPTRAYDVSQDELPYWWRHMGVRVMRDPDIDRFTNAQVVRGRPRTIYFREGIPLYEDILMHELVHLRQGEDKWSELPSRLLDELISVLSTGRMVDVHDRYERPAYEEQRRFMRRQQAERDARRAAKPRLP